MPKVTLSADRVQELSRSLEQALSQLRNDTSADASGWSELYSDDKMKAYQIDVPNCYIRKVKGEAIVNTSMTTHEFFDFIDEKLHEKIEKDEAIICDDLLTVLEPKPENAPKNSRDIWDIRHLKYNTPGGFLVSNRDLVSQTKTFFEGENAIRVTVHVDGAEFPAERGFVRAKMLLGGWYAEKLNDKQIRIVFVNHSDPCGMIPAMFINAKLLDAVQTVKKMKEDIEGN